jgi:signal transduction histidine kinase
MSRSSTLVAVRSVGLLAWLLIGGTNSLRSAPEIAKLARETPGGHSAVAAAVLWAVPLSIWLAFGVSFIWNTRRVEGPRPSRRSLAALLAGTACGALYSTDLLFLVAVEVPLVLSGRAVFAWMGLQTLATVARGLSVAGTGDFEPLFCGDVALPGPWLVGLSIAAIVVWQWLACAVGAVAARESRAHAELLRVNGELQATQGLLGDSARLAERLHISRELHDAVGHRLTALSINLDLAARRAQGEQAQAVREAHAVTRLLLGEVRQIVGELRTARQLDLRRALLTLGAAVEEPRVRVSVPEDLAVDPLRAHALYRCAQEALTNAVRHARAALVSITLRREQDELVLEVVDDGRGTRPVVPGSGLRGMRERIEEAGGRLELDSTGQGGLVVRAILPAVAHA